MKNVFVATFLLVLCVSPLHADQDLAQVVAKDYEQSLAELFVWFHSHPELSFREYETAARLAEELRSAGVEVLTIGQYLQPSKKHLPIKNYYTLEEFQELRDYGTQIGFQWVESGPLVRSSYHAGEQVRALSVVHRQLYGDH